MGGSSTLCLIHGQQRLHHSTCDSALLQAEWRRRPAAARSLGVCALLLPFLHLGIVLLWGDVSELCDVLGLLLLLHVPLLLRLWLWLLLELLLLLPLMLLTLLFRRTVDPLPALFDLCDRHAQRGHDLNIVTRPSSDAVGLAIARLLVYAGPDLVCGHRLDPQHLQLSLHKRLLLAKLLSALRIDLHRPVGGSVLLNCVVCVGGGGVALLGLPR